MPVKIKSKNENKEKKLIASHYRERREKKEFACKSEVLLSELEQAKSKRKNIEEIIIEEQRVSPDVELGAFIKECRNSQDGRYVVVTLLIFEMTEPVEKSFVFNRKTSAMKYLLQIANKFSEFRESKNIACLMGKAAVIMITENKGFENFKVIREITIEELDRYISELEEDELDEEQDYVEENENEDDDEVEDEEDE